MKDNTLGLYVHIPFCLKKCAYCDFCSSAGYDKKQRKEYLSSLLRNIEIMGEKAGDRYVSTVFFGGGTPTLLEPKEIGRLTDALYTSFSVLKDAEFTFECNPATLSKKLASALADRGVNRLSIGLQSANEKELKALSRVHTLKDFEESYQIARRAGFSNINIDLMYGLPEQTVESLLATIKYVISLSPEHISLYALQIEEGTEFYRKRDTLSLPSEDEVYEMYHAASELLSMRGYKHYEISNFARPGYECRHNLRYWREEEYIGMGLSAYSYFGGRRYGYTDSMQSFITAAYTDIGDCECDIEIIDRDTEKTEFVMLSLRLADGIKKKEYKERFGEDFDQKYRERLLPYIKNGFVREDEEGYSFTLDGMFVSNTVLSDILDL